MEKKLITPLTEDCEESCFVALAISKAEKNGGGGKKNGNNKLIFTKFLPQFTQANLNISFSLKSVQFVMAPRNLENLSGENLPFVLDLEVFHN